MNISINTEKLKDVIEAICDDYCKMPDICATQERLDKHCQECPLNNLTSDNYPLGRNDWQE